MPRTLSPYAIAELNLKETASGLRGGRIPKPVYVQVKPKKSCMPSNPFLTTMSKHDLVQVWRDFKPVLARIWAELHDAYLDTRFFAFIITVGYNASVSSDRISLRNDTPL